MRDIPGGWQCPAGGHMVTPTMEQQPPNFDGVSE